MTDQPRATNAKGLVQSVLNLAFGTAVVRMLSSFGSLVLALWLSPVEFGFWASAVSACAVLSSLTNFGLSSAYLAGVSGTLVRTRRVALFQNLGLSGMSLLIAWAYMAADRPEVALLVVVLGISIPLQGDADLLYSEGVRQRRSGHTVRAQTISAVIKTALGVLVAILTGSVAALAVSTFAYYVLLELLLLPLSKTNGSQGYGVECRGISYTDRFSWAVNAMLMSLPVHIPFLIAQFLADPESVGLLYVAFQVSLGISGMVAVPLNRVSVSVFSSTGAVFRARLAAELGGVFVAGTTMLCGLVALLAFLFASSLPNEWHQAVAPALILLASLPARILTPIVDGFQQAQGRWWQGSAFSALDVIGSAVASLSVLCDDIVIVAVSLTIWKVALGLVRSGVLLKDAGVLRLMLLQGLTIGGALVLGFSPSGLGWQVVAIVGGAGLLMLCMRLLRSGDALSSGSF